jgi:hypothetical protein
MSSRKFSLEAYFLIKARSETPNFNSVGHCSNTTAGLHWFEYGVSSESGVPVAGAAFASATKR